MQLATLITALFLTLAAVPVQAAGPDRSIVPLTRAHSHNDYEHPHPLADALAQGFCSVEADIYLVNGQLLVAHDRSKVSSERTLERLYLDPLAERCERQGGRVFQAGPPVMLLIDIKSEADATYAVLRQTLQRYSKILTRFTPQGISTGAVTAVLSGNRPRQMMERESDRFAALDGRPEDLETNPPAALVPLVSEDWKRLFKWRGNGPCPDSDRASLLALVARAHQQGRQIRFWGTPDQPAMWHELLAAQVDWINADDLAGLRKFLTAESQLVKP